MHYFKRVHDYMTDTLLGPVRWWEIFPALWYSLWNSTDYKS